MSCALVCHTAKGDCETLISPPLSGVVATTSKVGSWISSAREPIVVRARTTPAVAIRPATLVVILWLPFCLYSFRNQEPRARPREGRDPKPLRGPPRLGYNNRAEARK